MAPVGNSTLSTRAVSHGFSIRYFCESVFHFISLSAIFLLHLKNWIFFILIDGAKVRKKIEKQITYLLFLSKTLSFEVTWVGVPTLPPMLHSPMFTPITFSKLMPVLAFITSILSKET